ncbi:MAG: 4Fe-4S binding protein [Acutalibacteraceae bacterium]
MNYLKYIKDEIHTVIAATTDNCGLPITCAIDIMDYDENGLYFLTAKGKNFYNRLKHNGYVALTGMKGNDTLSCVAVSVRGKAEEIGTEPLDRLFEKNSYMKEIYPTEESRKALTVFRIYEGNGEWFDLSKKPIERASFAFGNGQKTNCGYEIGNNCVGCKACEAVCPQGCIDFSAIPAIIIQKNCLHCGNCLTVCPHNAVIRRG